MNYKITYTYKFWKIYTKSQTFIQTLTITVGLILNNLKQKNSLLRINDSVNIVCKSQHYCSKILTFVTYVNRLGRH